MLILPASLILYLLVGCSSSTCAIKWRMRLELIVLLKLIKQIDREASAVEHCRLPCELKLLHTGFYADERGTRKDFCGS